MFVRTAARAVLVLALSLVFADVALAGPPKDRTPPTAPTNFRITAGPVERSVSFAWNASKDNSSSWWYCVRRSGQGCFRVDPPRLTMTYAVLQPNTTYVFDVIAIDSAGNRSGASNSVTFTTPPDTTPPSPPPVISSTYVRPTRIGITWTSSRDNISQQVSYKLLVNGDERLSNMINLRGMTLLYLTPATTYTFEVIASDGFGNSTRSSPLSVTTPPATDTIAPTAPTNLRFSSETSPPEAWLDWDPASDDESPGDLMYEVFVNGVLASSGIGNNEDIVYCTLTGPNTIKVRAVDPSGNAGPFSNEIVLVC